MEYVLPSIAAVGGGRWIDRLNAGALFNSVTGTVLTNEISRLCVLSLALCMVLVEPTALVSGLDGTW